MQHEESARVSIGEISEGKAEDDQQGRIKAARTKDGLCKNHPMEYASWKSMIYRCTNPGHEAYERYAGRNITICDAWMSFKNFLRDMGPRPEGTTLDRYPNNDSGYRPDNCRWATRKQQARNKRGNVLVEYQGRTITVAELSECIGVDRKTLEKRISKYGISGERLLQKSCVRSGEDSARSKMTFKKAEELRRDFADRKGNGAAKFCVDKYGIKKSLVQYIVAGTHWASKS